METNSLDLLDDIRSNKEQQTTTKPVKKRMLLSKGDGLELHLGNMQTASQGRAKYIVIKQR